MVHNSVFGSGERGRGGEGLGGVLSEIVSNPERHRGTSGSRSMDEIMWTLEASRSVYRSIYRGRAATC